jgi:transposase
MRNGAGTRPPGSSGASGCGWRPLSGSPAGTASAEVARDLRVTEGSVRRWRRAWRAGGTQALRSRGPVSRERLSPRQWARLEAGLKRGPLAHGFAGDQYWTLGRIKTLTGRLFHVGYTVEGVWSLLKRAVASFAAAGLAGLVRIVKRKLKKIQYRPRLIDGCLAGTGLIIEPW